MIIREFTERDIDEITNLMKNLCKITGRAFNERRWRDSIESQMKSDSNTQVFVAFDKNTNQVIGMAYCSIRNTSNGLRFGYISNLIVKEEKRKQGIGERLMREIIDYFGKNHISSVRLALKTHLDPSAKILFTKLGFEEILRVFELKI
ncbi:MAG: GNAT family N-acetyltransferase [Promethearchaeota archaeon]|nr:MAG: GNAT family N-acetyltransferase [Candidatus Lokiarchaeota archaeon]